MRHAPAVDGGGRAVCAHFQGAAKSGAAGMIRSVLHPWRFWIVLIALLLLLAEALSAAPALITQKIVDEHLTTGLREGLLALAFVYYGSLVAQSGVMVSALYRIAVVSQGALHALRVRLFAHLQALPMSYFDRVPIGDIISRGTADVETVEQLFSAGAPIFLSSLFSLLTASAAMLLLSLPLSLVTALIVPLLFVITQFFRRRVREAERANRV